MIHETSQEKEKVAPERHNRRKNPKRVREVIKGKSIAKTQQKTWGVREPSPSRSGENIPSDSDTLSIESGMMDYEAVSKTALEESQELRGEMLWLDSFVC